MTAVGSYGLFIDNEECAASDGGTFVSLDPATGNVVGTFAQASASDVRRAVDAARRAQPAWAAIEPVDRGRLLTALRTTILDAAEDLSSAESLDTGKPLSQARSDVAMAARYLEFYASLADKAYGDVIPIASNMIDFTSRVPMGVVAQIVPWNCPLMLTMRSLAVSLATGNTIVVKTPEYAPLTSGMFSRLLAASPIIPPGVINIVHGDGDNCGAALATDPDVDLITFTGSVATGRKVAGAAAGNVVPTVLELGGKSPAVVYSDANLDLAVREITKSVIECSGQNCDAYSRVLVQRPVYDELADRFAQRFAELTVGPGLEDPDVGALINSQQLSHVLGLIQTGEAEGATVLHGGSQLTSGRFGSGYFVEPTLFGDVANDMSIAREEVFGPVLCVIPFDDPEDGIAAANDTRYGLAASVWSEQLSLSLHTAERLQAGQVYVNCISSGEGVTTPFGGFGESGYGREKGIEALRTYTQSRNLCIRVGKS